MSTQTQIRRGTSSQCDLLTPAEGEVIYDMTNDRTRIGDGVKAGGFHQASAADTQNGAFTYATAVGGTANAITLTVTQPPASYQAGQGFEFKAASTTGSGAVTVNAGPSAVQVYKEQSGSIVACDAGDFVAGGIYRIIHDGSRFLKASGSGGIASLTANNGLSGGTITTTGSIGIDLNNAGGIGSVCLMFCPSGIAFGSTTAGNSLASFSRSNTGGMVFAGAGTVSGTWRHLGGTTQATGSGGNAQVSLFQRIA